MHFTIVHEFDLARDALKRAVTSSLLAERLAARLASPIGSPARRSPIASIDQIRHHVEADILERVWHFQANVKLPIFAREFVTREMCAWREEMRFDLKTDAATWSVAPSGKPEWRAYFSSSGTYRIAPLGDRRAKRIVEGALDLRVPVVKQMAERMIVREIKTLFEAEAATLRDLAPFIP